MSAKRPKLLGYLDRIGTFGILIFALTVGVSVWGWLAYVVAQPQDFPTFMMVFLITNVVGGFVQVVLAGLHPSAESTASSSLDGFDSGVVFWGPTVLYAVVFLVVTPPSTSAAGFDPTMNIYAVMALVVLLGLIATAIGVVVLFGVVFLPLALILGGISQSRSEAREHVFEPVTGAQLSCAGLLILAAVGFAVSMQFVVSESSSRSSITRMAQQLIALITLRGVPGASIAAGACVAAMIVLVVISNRSGAQRRRTLRRSAVGAEHAGGR